MTGLRLAAGERERVMRVSMSDLSFELPFERRRFARIEDAAGFAGALVALGPGRARGLKRLWQKAAKFGYRTLHQRLGLPAPAMLALTLPTGEKRVAVDCRDTSYMAFAMREAAEGYEAEDAAVLDRILPQVHTLYDIGANWGFFSLLAATHPRFEGHVHAFELIPATAARLNALVGAASLKGRITVHTFGLSDRDGAVAVSLGNHSALAKVTPGGSGTRVPVRTVDSLGLPPPEFIKIDVEGHELAVFKGAEATLREAQPGILLESRLQDGAEHVLTWLADRGYLFFHARASGASRLALVPVSAEARLAMAPEVNLFGWPAARLDALRRMLA